MQPLLTDVTFWLCLASVISLHSVLAVETNTKENSLLCSFKTIVYLAFSRKDALYPCVIIQATFSAAQPY